MLRPAPAPAPVGDDIVDTTFAALLEVDLAEENAQMAEIVAKRDSLEEARQVAKRRADELHEQRHHPDDRSASDIANALLSGSSPDDAARAGPPPPDEQRKRLLDAAAELVARKSALDPQIMQIRHKAESRVRDTARPLVDHLHGKAVKAARELAQVFADLRAVNLLTGAGENELRRLGDVGLALFDAGLIDGKPVPASKAIVGLYEALSDKGPAYTLGCKPEGLTSAELVTRQRPIVG